ncbi:MAG: hypothetical protein K0U68_01270 [Gammaproteobacteria bacterium]|nr:hypothetical protein [Gammaproteobacteria bacterium]
MNTNFFKQAIVTALAFSALTASSYVTAGNKFFRPLNVQIGADNNSVNNPFVQPQDPALSGGGRDQTMQFGDVLFGSWRDDLQIGGLGVDIMASGSGNDIVIGGIEHFNPSNRDRAFGGRGNDIFIWKPGDGSDLWNGGPGLDVVVFGVLGEDVNGVFEFKVSNDQQTAKVAIDPETNLPLVDVSGSPGFCDVIDKTFSENAKAELDALDLDHLVRFTLRNQADEFKNGEQATDNGLRVTLHLKDVEILVCTNRDGGKIEVIDLRRSPARLISNSVNAQELRPYIKNLKLRKRLEAMVF